MGALLVIAGSLLFGLLLIMVNERQINESVSKSTSGLKTRDEGEFYGSDFNWQPRTGGHYREKISKDLLSDYQRIRKEVAGLRLTLFIIVVLIGFALYLYLQA